MEINKEQLVMQSVMGKIHHPISSGNNWKLNADRRGFVGPGTGGISYNVGVGDNVFVMKGDHIEPGVSIRNELETENNALMLLACVGNEATVVSGDAKGAKGYVIGTHGGIEHTIIEFSQADKEKMTIDDKIQIKSWGQGLEIKGLEERVVVSSLDPTLFEKMGITFENGKLFVPVVAEVPAYLMGSGTGANNAYKGDYDIMTTDEEEICRLGLDKLKYGDFVLIKDHTNTVGRAYLRGAATVGIVIHSNCVWHGHGPGVTTLLTSNEPIIEAKIDPNANIGNYMK